MSSSVLQRADALALRQFRDLAQRYLESTHERFPHEASRLGLAAFDHRLGKNTSEVQLAQLVTIRDTISAIEDLPEDAFTGDAWLDRRGFLALLRTRELHDGPLERWRNNPQVHCDTATDAIFYLLTRHASRLEKILPAIEARLKALPDFLAAGAECLRAPVPLWSRLALRCCEGSIHFLQEITPVLTTHSDRPSRTRRLLQSAARAFENYATAVDHALPGDEAGYALGREYFEFLMRERLGFDCTLPEAEANGRRLLENAQFLLKQEAAKFGKRPFRETIDQLAAEWHPEGNLLDDYSKTTDLLRQRLTKSELLTVPEKESLQVMLVPEFLKHHFPTAAYDAPGPFDRRQSGIFWVNDLSLKTTNPQRRALEISMHFGLELTSVHEAYPGHHLQFVIQNRHPSKLRRLFAHSIFYEGWTMWCEQLSVEHGLVDFPGARLIQLHDELWRAHRILIDCGLHSGRLTFDQACRQLVEGVGFTKGRAEGDVNWYTSAPTVPMSYLLGRLEVEKLHRQLVQGQQWPLRKFHDWLLSHGAIPPRWIARTINPA